MARQSGLAGSVPGYAFPGTNPRNRYDAAVSVDEDTKDLTDYAVDSEPQARRTGARQNVSDAVVVHCGGRSVNGWALNLSRGGLRAILECSIDIGERVDLIIGEEPSRPARVVWTRDEKDGAIVGMAFLDSHHDSVPPPPSSQTGLKR